MGFKLRPGTSVFGNVTFTPGTNENYVAPPAPPLEPANWVIISANKDDDKGLSSGSVYIYDAADLTAQPYKIVPTDGQSYDYFSSAIAVHGDTMFAGIRTDDDVAPDSGSVYVYDLNNLHSQPLYKITAFDGAQNDRFGTSVAVTADKIFVGADQDDDNVTNSGSVYVYDRNDLNAQPTKLTAFDGASSDNFGWSVAADSNNVVVGAWGEDKDGNNYSGAAYVYDLNDLTAQPTKLTPTTSPAADDRFGIHVGIHNGKILVGAYQDDNHKGSLYIYDSNDLTAQPTELVPFDGVASDKFAKSFSVHADKLYVGSSSHNGVGAVYVYDLNDLTAQPTKLVPSDLDGVTYGIFGNVVSATGDRLVVGNHVDDTMAENSGAVYVYDLNDLTAQPTKLTAFDGAKNDHFGIAVAVG